MYSLSDICEFNKFSYSSTDNWDFINYLDTSNITENKIDEIQFLNFEVDKVPSRAKRKVQIDDIVYSTVRPNQKHFGIIKEKVDNFLVSTGFTVISVKEKINADFLYYYLTQNHIIEALHNIAEQSTSAYPSIKSSDIGNIEVSLPELSIQEKIAKILNSIENKVQLNEKINHNLIFESTKT